MSRAKSNLYIISRREVILQNEYEWLFGVCGFSLEGKYNYHRINVVINVHIYASTTGAESLSDRDAQNDYYMGLLCEMLLGYDNEDMREMFFNV